MEDDINEKDMDFESFKNRLFNEYGIQDSEFEPKLNADYVSPLFGVFEDTMTLTGNQLLIKSLRLRRTAMLLDAQSKYDDVFMSDNDDEKQKGLLNYYTVLKTAHLLTQVINDLENDK